MVGETNRAPFDLPEAEGELVGGFHTEYSSMRFAMFFMAEYMNMITVSALAVTLFLGGYHAPLPFNLIPGADSGYWGVLWFLVKVLVMLFIFVWLRGTLPRMRYDQFMRFGWRWLIPISLVWTLMIAVLRVGQREGWFSGTGFWVGAVAIFVGLLALTFFGGGKEEETEAEPEAAGEFDAFAGGYPVPPMGDQVLPEFATVLSADEAADDGWPGRRRRTGGGTSADGFLRSGRGIRRDLQDHVPQDLHHRLPERPRLTAPRFHGRHQLNRWPDGLEKCVGCELCAWACPADAIYVEGAQNTDEERFSPGERYGRVYQINYLRCILCGLCIEACPTRALTMTNEFELADDSRGSLIYEKSDLLAPLLPGMTAAAARPPAGRGRAGLLPRAAEDRPGRRPGRRHQRGAAGKINQG